MKNTLSSLRTLMLLALCALSVLLLGNWALVRGQAEAGASLLRYASRMQEVAQVGSAELALEQALVVAVGNVETAPGPAQRERLAAAQTQADALARLMRLQAPTELTPDEARLHHELAQRRQLLLVAGVTPAIAALRDAQDGLRHAELLASFRPFFGSVHEVADTLRKYQREQAQSLYRASLAEQATQRRLMFVVCAVGVGVVVIALGLALLGVRRRLAHLGAAKASAVSLGAGAAALSIDASRLARLLEELDELAAQSREVAERAARQAPRVAGAHGVAGELQRLALASAVSANEIRSMAQRHARHGPL